MRPLLKISFNIFRNSLILSSSSNLYLRLRPDVVSVPGAKYVAVYSKSGAVLLDGPDARVVIETVFPLLDGTRTIQDLFAALPEITPADLNQVLQALREHSLLEDHPSPCSLPPSSEEITLRLRKAKVAVLGDAPLTALCVETMRNAGVGSVTVGFGEDLHLDLAVGIFDGREKQSLRDFAAYTHKIRMPSLTCTIYENEIIIGPFAIPGRTSCWNCSDLRLKANSEHSGQLPSAGDDEGRTDPAIAQLTAKQACEVISQGAGGSHLLNHILIFDRISQENSLHGIIGVPGCKVCGGPGAYGKTDSNGEHSLPAASSVEFALHALSWLVDSRTGIIRQLTIEGCADTGLELPFVATAITASAPGEFELRSSMPAGWGKGVTSSDAIITALGEAVERYSASLPNAASIVWSRPEDLSGEVLDPRMFALYDERQYARHDFPFVRFDPDISHPWVAGVWAGTQKSVWAPAILTYLSLVACSEHVFCQGTSNGLAAGTEREEVALRAIFELIERDAFMTSWRSRQPGRHLRTDQGLDPDLNVILSGIRGLGGLVEVVILESICGYPTAVCLAFGDGVNWPGVTLGLGTDPDPRTAVRKAILEQGQTGPYLRRLMKTSANAVPVCAQNVTEIIHHATYYFPKERASAFDYLRDDSHACLLADLPGGRERSLRVCSQDLAKSGVRAALADVTSMDIATGPFRVIRAISPDLQPISFGFGLDRLPVPHLANICISTENQIVPIW